MGVHFSSGQGAGLANLGNTCFLNAILQCFTHTVPLIQGLLSLKHESSSHGIMLLCSVIEPYGFLFCFDWFTVFVWPLLVTGENGLLWRPLFYVPVVMLIGGFVCHEMQLQVKVTSVFCVLFAIRLNYHLHILGG